MEKEIECFGKKITFQTGKVAKQANGSVITRCGDTVVLTTAVASTSKRPEVDFLPLIVDYQEMTYAAGKIPGGFLKREGKPTEKEILVSRLIDRSVRPLFPKAYRNETQVISIVLSADPEFDPDIFAIMGASLALSLSEIPFQKPIAGVRVSYLDKKFVVNPTNSERENSLLDIVVSGDGSSIVMVEGRAKEVQEDIISEALIVAKRALSEIVEAEMEIIDKEGKDKIPLADELFDEKIIEIFKSRKDVIKDALRVAEKKKRRASLEEILEDVAASFVEHEDLQKLRYNYEIYLREVLREIYFKERKRIDGRDFKDVRPITCEVGVLPRVHGSALFTRGETQVLASTTLGTTEDEQRIESLVGETYKRFMVHYNFPPFCVGEVRFLRAPSRREIGHGALAEKALSHVLPPEDDFPYTIRIVSDVLESNGSSSMATVCGGTLSLMDAGVPIKAPVAGIAMGLLVGDETVILTDILGDEDHIGDMDFKVAGTRDGVTAVQMDIKVSGISDDIISKALCQAKEARNFVLDKMESVIDRPRKSLSPYAPKIISVSIKPDRIRDLIGPAGKTIKSIIEKTGVKIDIDDSGRVRVSSLDIKNCEEAVKLINEVTQEVEVGKIYLGKVKKIMDYGAFVEILPNISGLLHISEITFGHVKNIRDHFKEGDEIKVKVIEIDSYGRIKLSRKETLTKPK